MIHLALSGSSVSTLTLRFPNGSGDEVHVELVGRGRHASAAKVNEAAKFNT